MPQLVMASTLSLLQGLPANDNGFSTAEAEFQLKGKPLPVFGVIPERPRMPKNPEERMNQQRELIGEMGGLIAFMSSLFQFARQGALNFERNQGFNERRAVAQQTLEHCYRRNQKIRWRSFTLALDMIQEAMTYYKLRQIRREKTPIRDLLLGATDRIELFLDESFYPALQRQLYHRT